MKDDQKTKAISFRGWQYIPIGPNISIKNIHLLGTSRKMIKNYVEIFINGSTNIELLILTMKTKYFCSAVVLEGFDIRLPVTTIFLPT